MSQPAALLARFPALSKPMLWPRTVQLGVAAAVIAILAVILMWARTPEYKVLFSNLADRDGGAIVTALTQMNVPYTFAENGNAILIPADKVYETRLRLAEQGLPRSGDTGFELLDKTRFGASQFTEQVNYQRALEGELTHSIEGLHSVQAARVHLAIPRETLFVRDRQPPTASVLVTLYPGRSLSETQIAAITWLVSSSVPHLTADKVSIVDQNGRLLTSSAGAEGNATTHRTFITDIEQRATERILTLLTPLVGPGNVRAQVSAQVDFAQREQTSEVYGPNQTPGTASIRSQQTSVSVQNNVTPAEGVPGALTNQPPANPVAPIINPDANIDPDPPAAGAPADPAAAQGNPAGAPDAENAGNAFTLLSGDASVLGAQGNARNDATTNYEVDRTISHIKEPVGKLQRLSAAVVVNYRDVDGEAQPLSSAELENLHSLVRQAMGFDAGRGDTLSVVNSPFSDSQRMAVPVWKDPVYIEYAMQLGRYLLFALLAWLVWRKVLRPIIESQTQARADAPASATPPDLQDKMDRAAEAQRRASEMSRYEDNLTAARTMAEQDPRAVAMVVRSWMEKDGNR